jgi:hypothetical protein
MGWGVLWVGLFAGWLVGLTTVPVLLWALWAYGTKDITPKDTVQKSHDTAGSDIPSSNGVEETATGFGQSDVIPAELKGRRTDPDVAAGYFAVCREYVPGGTNGKPPERTTPAGAVIAMESPSVYQTMYRSLFDRNKVVGPSLDGGQGKSKKARNVFYVVLRWASLQRPLTITNTGQTRPSYALR